MVHSALLRVFLILEISLSTVETEGRDSESPNPPAGVPKPSKYGGGLKGNGARLTAGSRCVSSRGTLLLGLGSRLKMKKKLNRLCHVEN